MKTLLIGATAALCASGAFFAYDGDGENLPALLGDAMAMVAQPAPHDSTASAAASTETLRVSAMVYDTDGAPIGAVRAIARRDGEPVSLYVRDQVLNAGDVAVVEGALVYAAIDGGGAASVAARR